MRLTLPFAKSKPAKKGSAAKRPKMAAEGRRATRRRARARWLRPALRFGAPTVLAGSIAAGGYLLWTDGTIQRGYSQAAASITEATVDAGLSVRSISVSGRVETNRQTLIEAIGVAINDPILAVDIREILNRVRGIGWVEDAVVERRLPDRLHIHLQERKAAAIWQHDGNLVLVDLDGNVIGADGLERYRHLKVIVGEDAPEKTAQLVELLATEPMLEDRIVAAVWIAGRRWNLRLKNGIDIRLPEENPAHALSRLAQLERDHKVLARDLVAIDLRQSDRLIVRMTEEAAERRRAHKDET